MHIVVFKDSNRDVGGDIAKTGCEAMTSAAITIECGAIIDDFAEFRLTFECYPLHIGVDEHSIFVVAIEFRGVNAMKWE